MAVKIQLRHGNASEWASANPILMEGEVGTESDTKKLKVGDGVTAWNSLAYAVGSPYVHPNHSGDVTSAGDGATTIANNAVINTKLADMATGTIKGRVAASTGDPEDLTTTQVRTLLNVADGANNYAHPSTHSADIIVDGTTNNSFTATEKTKLAGVSGTNTGDETTTRIGTLINGATAKTTPADADMVGIMDSAASNIIKKLSWSNIKTTLKTYFDTLYSLIGHTHVKSNITDFPTSMPANGGNADTLGGQNSAYHLNRTNHTGTQTASTVTIDDSGNNFTSTNVEGALSELFTSVSNGKSLIADTITDEGVTTSASMSFAEISTQISQIKYTPYNTLAVKCDFENGFGSTIGINSMIKSGTPDILYSDYGKFGKCYDASNATYIYPNYAAQTFTGDFSVSIWFKTSSTSGYRRLFNYSDNSRLLSVELGYSDNKIKVTTNNVDGVALISTNTYNDNAWHLLIFRKSGTSVYLTIDDTEELFTYTTLTGNITFAPSVSSSIYPLMGYIDNFCIWRHCLSRYDCTWLWNDGNGRP